MAEAATPQFHYPPAGEYTGLVQYRHDRLDTAQIKSGDKVYGIVRRAQVVKMKPGLAKLVVYRGGDFSHVAADTPEGVPEEYRPKAKEAPAAAAAQEKPLSVQIRESLTGRADLASVERRLRELADAAESSEKISGDAPDEIRLANAKLRADIFSEWRALVGQAAPEGKE